MPPRKTIQPRPDSPPPSPVQGSRSADIDETVVFEFGKPDSALAPNPARELTSILAMDAEEYYRPSIPFEMLALLGRTHPQHSPLPIKTAEWVVKYMKPNPLVSREILKRAVMEDASMGNAFFQLERNRVKGVLGVGHSPTINTRRMKKEYRYGWIDRATGKFEPYQPGEVVHVMQYESIQNIYGVPYWIGALQSILLGEDVRLFPRRFFGNGAHTGKGIFTVGLNKDDRKLVNEQLAKTKGSGNFRSVVLHLPKVNSGKVDDIIKVMSFDADQAAKIDYTKLADMSSDDVLEAWGYRPEVFGQTPNAIGGTGDLDKLVRLTHEHFMVPIQQRFADALNEHLPSHAKLAFYGFDEYQKEQAKGTTGSS